MDRYVLVYGAYGHTGRFVAAELLRQGLTPILSGRNPARLDTMAWQFPGLEVRPATVVDNSHSLQNAVRGAGLVVNCAGPFLDTAIPVAAAAVRAGAHYLDVTAEQAAVQEVYRAHQELEWRTNVRSHTGDGVLRRARRPASDRRRGRLGNQRRDHRRHRP